MSKTIRELIEEGVIELDTKVLGVLPRTKDKCIVGDGVFLYDSDGNKTDTETVNPGAYFVEGRLDSTGEVSPVWERTEDCYSTPEAAAASRKDGM